MEKILRIAFVFGIVLMLLISTAFATGINIEVNEDDVEEFLFNNLEIFNDEIIDTDLMLIQDNISVNNNVNGNVYMIGEVVNISSELIDGDIFVVANHVTINSNVNGNVYVLTNNLNISGEMKDIYVFAENVILNDNTICRDLKTFATNINIEGIINRDLYAATGEVNISLTGKINGSLSTTNERVEHKENVNEIKIIEDITKGVKDSEDKIEEFAEAVSQSIKIFFFVSAEVIGLIIILIIVLFSSNKSMSNSELKEYVVMDTVYGLLYFILAILMIGGLIFTLVGIPISILLALLLWFICWKITIPVASIQISKAVLKQENRTKALVWIISFIIFTLVQVSNFIPTFGGLIKAIVSLYGFGYMIRSVIRKNKQEDENIQVEVI